MPRPLRSRWLSAVAALATAWLVACQDPTSPESSITGLALLRSDTLVAPGDSLQLVALPVNRHGLAVASATVTWTSRNSGVLTVSPTGMVLGVSPGTTRVIATSGGHSDSLRLVVGRAACGTPAGAGLSVGMTRADSITVRSCLFFGDEPATGYPLSVPAGTRARITVTGVNFRPNLLVTDIAGNVINGAAGAGSEVGLTMEVTASIGGLWVVGPPAIPAGGARYTISVTTPPSACSAANATAPIVLGATVPDTITANSCILIGGPRAVGWRFTVSERGRFRFSGTSPTSPATIAVTDTSVAMLGFTIGSAPGTTMFDGTFNPGTYYVWVGLWSGGTGPVTARVDTVPPCTPSGTLTLGTPVDGALSSDDCRAPFRSAFGDLWTLTLADTTTVQLDLQSSAIDAFLGLLDSSGTVVATDDDGGGDLNSRIVRRLAPGRYEVWASSYGGSEVGAYSLQAQTTTVAPACGAVHANRPIALATAVADTITAASCTLVGGPRAAGWRFTVTERRAFRFSGSADTLPATIAVTDTTVALRGFTIGSSPGTTTFDGTFDPGTYFVWVALWNGGTGPVTARVDTVPPCAPSGALTLGTTVNGALSTTDCRAPFRPSFGDLWTLTLSDTTTVQFDLQSSSFDAYLGLLNAAGAVVATDDDGGGSLNSRIVRRLPPGSYAVWAASFGDGETGAYTLRAQVSAGALRATPTPATKSPSQAWKPRELDLTRNKEPRTPSRSRWQP